VQPPHTEFGLDESRSAPHSADRKHRSGGRHRSVARRRVSLLSRAVLAVVATLLAIGGTVATAAVQTPENAVPPGPARPSSHLATPSSHHAPPSTAVRHRPVPATRTPSGARTSTAPQLSPQNGRGSRSQHGDVGLPRGRRVSAPTATGSAAPTGSTSASGGPGATRTGATGASQGTSSGAATGTPTGTGRPTTAIDSSTRPAPGQSVAGRWVLPNAGPFTSCYCARWGTFHYGIDLAGAMGSPILAAGDGTVVRAGPATGFGNWVVIQHGNGDVTIYGHMRIFYVHVGQVVHAGQEIALVGAEGDATGPHLHFGVRLGGLSGPYTDPVPWLAARGVTVGRYTGN
jgi:murein DD-endopeptidase MepM/ murein hydrolase activator NlpD